MWRTTTKHVKVVIFAAVFASAVKNGNSYLENLGQQIESEVRRSLAGLENLGPSIDAQVRGQLAPLNNLGANIQQSVYEGLAPVRALQALIAVKTGQNGYTVATYNPGGRTFIVKEGRKYECPGTLSTNGQCAEQPKPFQFTKDADYCFADNINRINNQLCFTSGPYGVSVSNINGNIQCTSYQGSTLLITVEKYKEMCQNVASSASYTYYPNYKAQLENNNVKCQDGPPQVCTYAENDKLSQLVNFNSVSVGQSIHYY